VSRRPAVFATGVDWVQLIWRRASAGRHIVEVGAGSWTFTADGQSTAGGYVHGLEPGTHYDVVVNGRAVATVQTLARPPGRLLARVATISDLHIGELAFGFLPRMRTQPKVHGDPAHAHPMWTLRAAMEEISAWAPDLLVVKGDLGHRNVPREYDLLASELLRPQLPLLVTGGNHDGGNQHRCEAATELARHGIEMAGAVQVRDVGGARIVLADTVVDGAHGGTIAREHHGVLSAVRGHPGPCLVALHHQLMTMPVPYYLPVGIPRREGRRFLDELAGAHPGALVTSGHTHRNRVRRHGPLVVTEVGSPKDHPGVWGAYELYEGGIVQTVRRIIDPRTLAWSERCGGAMGTVWGKWSPGRLTDRCVVQLR
jgi:3',5'-cyclic-AMP phosphodiesterase